MKSCISVLVIEDEDHIRRIIKYNLELEGFKVDTAENGKIGLEMLHSMKHPTVILLDWNMPEKDGLETLTAIRKDRKTKKIPVVMLTAKGTLGDVEQAYMAKANGYITKPFDPEKLGFLITEKLNACVPRRQQFWNKQTRKLSTERCITRDPENLVS